jgi:hypothetical protein
LGFGKLYCGKEMELISCSFEGGGEVCAEEEEGEGGDLDEDCSWLLIVVVDVVVGADPDSHGVRMGG